MMGSAMLLFCLASVATIPEPATISHVRSSCSSSHEPSLATGFLIVYLSCDFIVCWENDLEEMDEDMPEIISLKEFIFR